MEMSSNLFPSIGSRQENNQEAMEDCRANMISCIALLLFRCAPLLLLLGTQARNQPNLVLRAAQHGQTDGKTNASCKMPLLDDGKKKL